MSISWVVKTSKFCNLRCKYCYEWPYLDSRDILSLENWRNLVRSALDYHIEIAAHSGTPSLTYIIWHGGEPLLMSNEYFHEVFAIQAEILGEDRTQFRNA